MPRKKFSRSKKRGPVVAKKVVHDGIQFASGLEKHMYIALKKHKLFDQYEGEVFHLVEGFRFGQDSFERQSNGKGDMINRGNKKILGIKYTPDFTSYDYIIETKGRANESFPIRYKLFKKWLVDNNDRRVIYKPQRQTECDEVVQLILKKRREAIKKEK